MEDYHRLLEIAYRSMKAADPSCVIVGGMGTSPDSDLTRQFIEQGGLNYVDVVDIHIHHPPLGATYADDDPTCIQHSFGDEAMNRCRWPNERDAAEHVVKFAAMSFAYGVRKIFFHAGTCRTLNTPDAGGVFFEYSKAPRKAAAFSD